MSLIDYMLRLLLRGHDWGRGPWTDWTVSRSGFEDVFFLTSVVDDIVWCHLNRSNCDFHRWTFFHFKVLNLWVVEADSLRSLRGSLPPLQAWMKNIFGLFCSSGQCALSKALNTQSSWKQSQKPVTGLKYPIINIDMTLNHDWAQTPHRFFNLF